MMKTRLAVATLMVAGVVSLGFADDPKKPEIKGEPTVVKKKSEPKGEKPKASPGWVIIEEDWSYPFLDDFSAALHKAREHYRAKEEKAASAEIDKAISWLKYAEGHASKSLAEDLSIARSDLMDFSASLKSGKPVLASKLDSAFAHASAALARHHYFDSTKALAAGDVKTAGMHLMTATDLIRNAAQSANLEYGSQLVDIDNDYAPYGYWDDTVVLVPSKVEANLTTVDTELKKLATKLKSGK
jgi:hypothetical protein